MRMIYPFLMAVLLTAAASAAPTLTTLPNGMEVMLIENHSNPVIASVVVIRTGLRNETVELNGATHFLEHLLFNGTETRTQKQLYDEMDFLGGYNNASTSFDHTTFQILLEKSNFEKGLEIQADMLFHSNLPPDKFEKEKGIVIEEIGKDEDTESYRVERFFEQVTYRGTPYQWPILGSRQSIRRLTRDQVFAYYKTYYVPNNMTALLMGDFDTTEMLKTLQRIFGAELPGTLPAPSVLKCEPLELAQEAGALHYFNQGEATAHHIQMILPAPTRSSPDYFPFMVLTRLLEDRLDKEIKSNAELGVTEISTGSFTDRDFATLQVNLTVDLKNEYEPISAALHQTITQFVAGSFEKEKVQNVITSIRAEDTFNSERPHYYGMLKSEDLAQRGPYFLLDYQERLSAVTVADVQQVAEKYLGPTYPVVAVYQALAPADAATEKSQESKLVHRQLPNGLVAIVEENQDSKVFAAHFFFKNRSALEIKLGGKPGMVDFLHHLFDQGPQTMDKEAFQSRLQSLGAQVKFFDMAFIPYDDYYTTPEFSYVRLEGLDENYAATLDLISQALLNPNLTPPKVEATRGQMTGLAKRQQASVQERGKNLFKSVLYGDSPLTASITGSPQDIGAFAVEDLQRFYQSYFCPNNLILSVVTSNSAEAVMQEIEKVFSAWSSNPSLPEAALEAPAQPVTQQEQSGGKEQSFLGMGYAFKVGSSSDEAPLTILNTILSDRMQFQLREKEGLAYTLGSSVTLYPGWGVWMATMGTAPKNLERAQQGIREQLTKASKEKFAELDVAKARNAYLGRQLLRGLSRLNQAYLMGLYEFRGVGPDYYSKWLEALRQVTAQDVQRVARVYLTTDYLSTAIVR